MNLLQQFFGNKKFVFSVMVLLPLIVIALFGPLIIRHDPLEMNTKRVLEPPSTDFLLGTDEYGRCILCRMIIGIRPTLFVAFGGAAVAMMAGSTLGLTAGYIGGKLGNVIMRAIDIVLCFPPILLAMLVVGLWGTGIINLLLVIGILYTPHFCRIAYSTTLKLRKAEFVENQRILGASTLRIVGKTLFPNILSPLIIQFSITVANGVLLESGLSFLGLGVPPPHPSWGQMIGKAKNHIVTHEHYMFFPSLCLCLTILATNLMGDALRDVLDPKLKESH